jgi:hypothetical protein
MTERRLVEPGAVSEVSIHATSAADAPAVRQSDHGPDCMCTRCTGFQPGHGLSVRHGAQATLRLQPRAEEITRAFAVLAPVEHPADGPALELLGVMFARLEAVSEYVAERGLTRPDGSLLAVLDRVGAWEGTAVKLLDRLGMTSAGRADLGLVVAKAQEIAAGTLDYSRLDDAEVTTLRTLVEKASPS